MAIINKIKGLVQHQGFRRYAANTSWMMAEQMLRIIAGLLVGIWVARYLGPQQFGLISYVLAFTAIFGGIAKLGLDGILVRELVNHPEKRDTYLGTAFWLKILGAFIVMGVMAAIVPFTSNDATTNLFIFIIAAGLVFQSFEVVEFYFQSQVFAKIVSICKVIQLALSSIIKIYLVLTEAELIWFVLVTAFDALSLAVSYFIAYQLRKNPAFYKHFDLSIAKQLLKDSWPLIFSAIVVSIYMRIDQIMIKEMLGEYEVGIYSAAVRLSEAFYFIPVLITTSLFPAILNAKNQSDELYKERLQRLYTFMIWMAIAIAFLMTFLSDWVVLLLFGQAYQEASHVLVLHIWGILFVSIAIVKGKWQMSENLTKHHFIGALVSAISNVILNFFMIPLWGVVGAALSTVVSQFIAGYLINYFFVELRGQSGFVHRALVGVVK
ncbi:flippase [Pseudomonas sihuiensis]|uniref:Membrane protein involved in the export of O-antigen and teichoic acid n=1 Tax=Pseudomonas sihuiensis TaxID=1274359 RepID=A0A1H2L9G3_9PSED|nr:flippase [Pseudomonas sihuiensis]SDU77464.1 Membrane protein involved in the export of O-antigen and teichoic acid [Pseudomonas sihuiensis]